MHFMTSYGWIEVICGCMFSGKSEELIRQVRRATYGQLSVRVYKQAIDDRYDDETVVSHNGASIIARPVNDAAAIRADVGEHPVDVVAVDEGQFFDDELVSVVNDLADKGMRVIVSGLDLDFRGEPFGPMPQLMAQAEWVHKLNAICPICAASASRTQRLIDGEAARYDDSVIMVGAAESYEPRCRYHHDVPH